MEENNGSEIEKIIIEYEKTLSWKVGGDISQRVQHCLSQYRQIAGNSIYKTKSFMDDVKTQFKALEMITEGLTSEGMNHSQKRVIANHIITMLRTMVDRISQTEFEYSTNNFERYNFFRSETPEKKLYEDRANLSQVVDRQNAFIKNLKEKHPLIFNQIEDDIPF